MMTLRGRPWRVEEIEVKIETVLTELDRALTNHRRQPGEINLDTGMWEVQLHEAGLPYRVLKSWPATEEELKFEAAWSLVKKEIREAYDK